MKNLTLSLVAAVATLLVAPTFAAIPAPAQFDPVQTFAPYSYPQPATAYR